jgi:hypothetical protein
MGDKGFQEVVGGAKSSPCFFAGGFIVWRQVVQRTTLTATITTIFFLHCGHT